jgi:hypothetical protein
MNSDGVGRQMGEREDVCLTVAFHHLWPDEHELAGSLATDIITCIQEEPPDH